MIVEHQPAVSSTASTDASSARSFAAVVLRRLIGQPACGELVIDTPKGDRLTFEGSEAGPRARLSIHDWRLLGRLVAGWDIGLAESYMAGEWSSPNLTAMLTLAGGNGAVADPLRQLRALRLWPRLRHAMNRNTRRGSRRNIAAHYDLGNAFYRLWLDAGMSYSAGLYSSPHQTLESAQAAKLDRVCELLELAGGERVLEIGCGWGALAERLMNTTTCSLTGVTLSTEQLAYAQSRLSADVQSGRCELHLQDYRDVAGRFDRIVSIEMLEAVGEAYWPTYFAKLRDSLRSGGIAVLQVITIDETRFESYRRRPDFIQKYIFPGGMLPTKQIIAREADAAGLKSGHECFVRLKLCPHDRGMAPALRGSLASHQAAGFRPALQAHVGVLSRLLPGRLRNRRDRREFLPVCALRPLKGSGVTLSNMPFHSSSLRASTIFTVTYWIDVRFCKFKLTRSFGVCTVGRDQVDGHELRMRESFSVSEAEARCPRAAKLSLLNSPFGLKRRKTQITTDDVSTIAEDIGPGL